MGERSDLGIEEWCVRKTMVVKIVESGTDGNTRGVSRDSWLEEEKSTSRRARQEAANLS